MKKYRVVRVVVQVQATITQRRGGPTTLVTGDACNTQENNNKPTATPPSISRFPAAMNHSHQLKHVTLFWYSAGSSSVPICILLTGWVASQPALYTHMKGFHKSFYV